MLGERIKNLRKERKITQGDLAKSVGITQGFVSDLERGKTTPGSDVLLSISRFFMVDVQWLLTGEGEMRPKKAAGEETNDPQLLTQVEAARRDRFGDIEPEPLVLTQTEASIIEYLRDLPDQTRLDACDHIRELWLRHRQRQNLSK